MNESVARYRADAVRCLVRPEYREHWQVVSRSVWLIECADFLRPREKTTADWAKDNPSPLLRENQHASWFLWQSLWQFYAVWYQDGPLHCRAIHAVQWCPYWLPQKYFDPKCDRRVIRASAVDLCILDICRWPETGQPISVRLPSRRFPLRCEDI